MGRKPTTFVAWMFDALGALPGLDELDDLFPGTGVVGQCWRLLASQSSRSDAVSLMDGARQNRVCQDLERHLGAK